MLDRDGGVVAAAAGDDRHPSPRSFDRDLDHPALLGPGHGRALAGRSARNQPVRSLLDLPLY